MSNVYPYLLCWYSPLQNGTDFIAQGTINKFAPKGSAQQHHWASLADVTRELNPRSTQQCSLVETMLLSMPGILGNASQGLHSFVFSCTRVKSIYAFTFSGQECKGRMISNHRTDHVPPARKPCY